MNAIHKTTTGAGNPFARQMARLRKAAIEAISENDIREVLAALTEKAKAGNVAAAKLLRSYRVVKPPQTPEQPQNDRLHANVNG